MGAAIIESFHLFIRKVSKQRASKKTKQKQTKKTTPNIYAEDHYWYFLTLLFLGHIASTDDILNSQKLVVNFGFTVNPWIQ